MSFSFRNMLGESSGTSPVSQSIPPALKSPPKMRVVLGLFLKVNRKCVFVYVSDNI